jgi:hypothetical protein
LGTKKPCLAGLVLKYQKNQAAFFLLLAFFFLAAFLAALGASAAGLAAGAAAGATAGAGAGAAAGAAGTTGAVGAAVCATEAKAMVLKTPATMSLYMELPSIKQNKLRIQRITDGSG